jgi:hypothetical protein
MGAWYGIELTLAAADRAWWRNRKEHGQADDLVWQGLQDGTMDRKEWVTDALFLEIDRPVRRAA